MFLCCVCFYLLDRLSVSLEDESRCCLLWLLFMLFGLLVCCLFADLVCSLYVFGFCLICLPAVWLVRWFVWVFVAVLVVLVVMIVLVNFYFMFLDSVACAVVELRWLLTDCFVFLLFMLLVGSVCLFLLWFSLLFVCLCG